MLIPTMSSTEVTREIHEDWVKCERSAIRLAAEYDKQRKKLKINRADPYFICYSIKSVRKNNWVFIFSKSTACDHYKGLENVKGYYLVYYYTKIGLRVFKLHDKNILSVYNGHLFTRYKERMLLPIEHPLEIVKHFFSHNAYCKATVVKKDGKDFTMAICKDGLLLGELQEDTLWILYKTFLNRDSISKHHRNEEVKLIITLGHEIEEALKSSKLDLELFRGWAEILNTYKID